MSTNPKPVYPEAERLMPDVARDVRPGVSAPLDWVGMGEIEMPVRIRGFDDSPNNVPARVSAFVNLSNKDVRGIHMSRLYLHLDKLLSYEPINPQSLKHLLQAFLDSHKKLSAQAMVRLRFDFLTRRKALSSENEGWKRYPVEVCATLIDGQFSCDLGLEVLYSSTCPCSAALARQLVAEKFAEEFNDQQISRDAVLKWLRSEKGTTATPHSQRSAAEVRVKLSDSFVTFPLLELIDSIEDVLQTPVQAAVKREDEQAFARLNGQNLMFCEDAGRRLFKALDADDRIEDFWARATHFESLHPHNAVAVVTKGVEGGFRANEQHFNVAGEHPPS